MPASLEASLEAEGVRDLSGQSTHKTGGFTVNRSADLPPLFLPLSSFSLSTSPAKDRECKALKSTLPQKEYPDTGKVDKREGWE